VCDGIYSKSVGERSEVKVVTPVRARPQLIEAALVSKVLRSAGHTEFRLHTGQHYSYGTSRVFFDEFGLPVPDVNLDVRSGSPGLPGEAD
jgi:UDP-N-acetylglucosamine 2-epimerase